MILNTRGRSRRGLRRSHLSVLMVLALFLAASVLAPMARAQDDDPTWANELVPRSGVTTPPGRWLPAKNQQKPSTLTEEQQREIDRLNTIGYLGGHYEPPATTGLTIYDPERASSGHNLYTSGHFPGAVLMDMEGNILHTWRCGFLDAFPGRADILEPDRSNRWRYVHLFDNGDVLGIYEGLGLVKRAS